MSRAAREILGQRRPAEAGVRRADRFAALHAQVFQILDEAAAIALAAPRRAISLVSVASPLRPRRIEHGAGRNEKRKRRRFQRRIGSATSTRPLGNVWDWIDCVN